MSTAQDASSQVGLPLRWRYGDVDDGNFAVRGLGVPLLVALLFVLACFVAVCLYLRWACLDTDGTVASTSSSSPSSHAVEPAPSASASAVAGLDAATIASLPVAPYRAVASPADRDGGAAQCSICLSEFEEGEKFRTLPRCGHGFHPECVDAWLRSRPSCPMCRSLLLPAAATNKPDVVGSDAV